MPLNINFQQILLHAFNLVILVGGLYILLYKPVRDFMRKREAAYEAQRQDAANKQHEAEALLADYRQKVAGADEEIRALRQEGAARAEKEGQKIIDDARAEGQKIVSAAREHAQREEKKLLEHAQEEIIALSLDAARKLMSQPMEGVIDDFLTSCEGSDVNGRA